MKNDENAMRELLVAYGKKLLGLGLVQGTWGNLSVRLSANYMLTTPSGRDYTSVTPADMVKVSIRTLAYGDGNKPTSEKRIHAGIYEQRAEVGAIIHTHAKYCSIFAAAERPLQIVDDDLRRQAGELIYLADYGFAGTKTLTRNVVRALGDRRGCIMSHHGMVAVGKDLEDALKTCIAMEEAAKRYIETRLNK